MPSAGQAASTSVPPFVIKLYDLVTQPETDGIVCWGSTGNSFLLLDTRLFSQLVLPMHFKHDNLRSFERQLNIYGFQRCIAQPTEHALEFFHAKFRRGQRDLLLEIKRSQPARKRQLSADAPSAPGSTLAMDEASALNALQETMTETAAGATPELGSKVVRAALRRSLILSGRSVSTFYVGVHCSTSACPNFAVGQRRSSRCECCLACCPRQPGLMITKAPAVWLGPSRDLCLGGTRAGQLC